VIVLDAGALVALDRDDAAIWARLELGVLRVQRRVIGC